ncbi:MAG TPA: ABC transporter ATP-binding protein [Gemmatimonadaceae bacterium]
MIDIAVLTKRFGRLEVLRGVDVHIARGRITGIVGPNGAGKSTFLKIVLGLVHPTSGMIRVDGRLTGDDEAYRANIGYMPQMGRVPDNLTTRELIATMRELRGADVPIDLELADTLGLREQLDKPLRTLSGGTRQKVNACLALLFRPKLVVLDEPTAGLDPRSSALLKDKLLSLRSAGGTVILASHVMSELEDVCDDVVCLLDGVVRYAGPVTGLRKVTHQPNLERAIAALMIREVA